MKLQDPSVEILTNIQYPKMLNTIRMAIDIRYKTAGEEKLETVIRRLTKINGSGLSLLEHELISVKFICDRRTSHRLVRHRLCSFSQESTSYSNYIAEGHLTFICHSIPSNKKHLQDLWMNGLKSVEMCYFQALEAGMPPEDAASLLPSGLKTEIMVTANIRQWREIIRQRTASNSHGVMKSLMSDLLTQFCIKMPVFFNDLIKPI